MEIKICKTCNKNPVRTENRKGKIYQKHDCSTCCSRKWSQKYPEKRKIINKRFQSKYKIKNWAWKEELMAHIEQTKCLHCNENDIRCMQFHHRDPKQKKFKISWGWTHYMPIEDMKVEAEKCDVLCANCHIKLHSTKFY